MTISGPETRGASPDEGLFTTTTRSGEIIEVLAASPLALVVRFATRCARRVEPLWGQRPEHEFAELRSALETAERVAEGKATFAEARVTGAAAGKRWSARRPTISVELTAPGSAVYALVCACSDRSEEAAGAALLAAREAQLAAGGGANDMEGAEQLLRSIPFLPDDALLRPSGSQA